MGVYDKTLLASELVLKTVLGVGLLVAPFYSYIQSKNCPTFQKKTLIPYTQRLSVLVFPPLFSVNVDYGRNGLDATH